jgi:hypothetical protein
MPPIYNEDERDRETAADTGVQPQTEPADTTDDGAVAPDPAPQQDQSARPLRTSDLRDDDEEDQAS